MTEYDNYLELLNKYVKLFEGLSNTQRTKLSAMQQYNIEQLNDCMKKEQADTLLLRGYDKKRLQLQKQLSLGEVPFSQILLLIPKDRQFEFSQIFRSLSEAYEEYKSTAECARQMIELNIYRLGNAINELKKKTNTSSAPVYEHDGTINSEGLSFKDMKI